MKTFSFFSAISLAAISVCTAESTILYFEKVSPKEYTHVTLSIEDNEVSGSMTWQPLQKHGATGSLSGTISGNLIKALYEYSIEGSDQSEQKRFKLDGDRLWVGEGELVDPKDDGHLVFKDPSEVKFENWLKKVEVSEPKAGSPERKAIMDAMRTVVAREIGKPVTFTGTVTAFGSWARFDGNVAPTDGKPPKNEEAASLLELDFFALLRKTEDGNWKVLHSGFAGDITVRDEAREKFPKAPWVLFE